MGITDTIAFFPVLRSRTMKKTSTLQRRQFIAALALSSPWLAGNSMAQTPNWPARTIRLVVPFPPGGGTDYSPPRCAALSGKVGEKATCGIYEWRPS